MIANFTLTAVAFLAVNISLGLWGIACEYLVYNKNGFRDEIARNITLAWLSVILNQLAGCLVLTVASLPIVSITDSQETSPSGRRNYYNIGLYALLAGILSCWYFAYFYVEVFVQRPESVPVLFTLGSAPYFLAGFVKTLPSFSLLACQIIIDMRQHNRGLNPV